MTFPVADHVDGGCYIHSDICDFHSTPSNGNKKYVITFIDDYTRFYYVYLLHSKDEALDKFKIYKTEVELQLNKSVKCLRTDRGGEYMNPQYLQVVGIIHETTAPYTPKNLFDFINHVKNTYYSVINLFGILKCKYSFGKRFVPICWVLFPVVLLKRF